MATEYGSTPNVDFRREEVLAASPQWALIRDCLAGETVVKARRADYLPSPSIAGEHGAEARYTAYLTRAVFYNVTKRTLSGLVGQVFNRDPIVEVPTVLDILKSDATGSGVDLEQLAKQATSLVLAYGRSGVLVDYPVTEGRGTQAEVEAGELRPMLQVYDPWDIVNWRTVERGGKTMLSLVVLRETYVDFDDGFATKLAYQWRVFRLVGKQVEMEIYRSNSTVLKVSDIIPQQQSTGSFTLHFGPAVLLDFTGNPLDEIPFMFMGSDDNENTVDPPPLYDLASLNMAHYRNSADYEEACFVVGQPTPWATGLTQEWVTQVLGNKLPFGSRGGIMLPANAQTGLLQPQPNTLPFEAMQHKERQMIALGAKLVEQKTVQRTATEADIENTSENSTLANSAKNVSAAFTWALNFALRFTGGGNEDSTQATMTLNTEFDLVKLSPQERQQLISEWVAGALTFEEMRESLRRAGIATLDDKEAMAKIRAEQEQDMADAERRAAATGANEPPE